MLILSIPGAATIAPAGDDPVLRYNLKIEEQFGSTEEIIVFVSAKGSVFDKKVLAAIEDIIETGSIDISDEMSDEDVEAVREAIDTNPVFAGKLVGSAGNATIIIFPYPGK